MIWNTERILMKNVGEKCYRYEEFKMISRWLSSMRSSFFDITSSTLVVWLSFDQSCISSWTKLNGNEELIPSFNHFQPELYERCIGIALHCIPCSLFNGMCSAKIGLQVKKVDLLLETLADGIFHAKCDAINVGISLHWPWNSLKGFGEP